MSEPRELLLSLFDEDSFTETYNGTETAGVITGYGDINGTVVYAFSQDADEKSGAMNRQASIKIKKLYAMAVKNGSPILGIYNSKGGAIDEGQELLAAYGDIISEGARLSGVVPQISIVNGICAGVMSTLCCMADFVIMTEKSEFFLTPPFIAKDNKLSGAGSALNAVKSGVASILVKDTKDAVEKAKKIISFLPQNNLELCGNDYFEENDMPVTENLKGIDLIKSIADKESTVEFWSGFGSESITALGSFDWKTIGFVSAGNRLNSHDSVKIARFVSFCDAFSIPVVTVVDTEGFEPSSAEELAGGIRDSAKLAQVYAAATTPKISLITGNAIGAAVIAMQIFGAGSDFCLAYKNAIVSPVTVKAGADFLNLTENEYIQKKASAECAVKLGYIDRIVEPGEIKSTLTSIIDATNSKRVQTPSRKHINFIF